MYRPKQYGRIAVLGQIAGGAVLQGSHSIYRLGIHGQHQHGKAWLLAAHLLEQLQAVLIGQADVDNGNVKCLRLQHVQGRARSFGLGHDFDAIIRAQHQPNAVAGDDMVVHQQHPDFSVSHAPPRIGNCKTSKVPCATAMKRISPPK